MKLTKSSFSVKFDFILYNNKLVATAWACEDILTETSVCLLEFHARIHRQKKTNDFDFGFKCLSVKMAKAKKMTFLMMLVVELSRLETYNHHHHHNRNGNKRSAKETIRCMGCGVSSVAEVKSEKTDHG